MFCKVLNELAQEPWLWSVHTYNAKTVEDDAIRILGERANGVLRSPRSTLGPPFGRGIIGWHWPQQSLRGDHLSAAPRFGYSS